MRLAGPLVTTGSTASPAGGIGQPSTTVLYGNQNVDLGLLSGVRLDAGFFLDRENRFSLDWNGLWVPPGTQTFSASSDSNGNPVLSRPFFNASTGLNGVFVNSLPGVAAGTISVETKSQMEGFEFNGGFHTYYQGNLHLESLFGFRYLRLAERLNIQEQINPLQSGFLTYLGNFVNAPNSLSDYDSFSTTNQFFGPQIGARISWEQKWFTLDAFGKLALGVTSEQTNINGTTTLISPNGNQTANGGILALPSNIGAHNRTEFGILPEVGFNLYVNLTSNVRLNMGYSLMMWNHVLRPGDQYDLGLTPGQIPGSPFYGNTTGPVRPAYRFNDSFFFANTFNIGLEFHY